jgi:hypothetical protein
MRLAYAVNLTLDRSATGPSPVVTQGQPPTPSPYQPVWPEGWGLPPGHTNWNDCIFESKFPVLDGTTGLVIETNNTALLAWNASRNQYALAFAGTKNELNALEDLAAIPVSAGPLKLGELEQAVAQHHARTPAASSVGSWLQRLGELTLSSSRYVPASYTPPRPAQMHLGFRLAFESLNSRLTVGLLHRPLSEALSKLPNGAELFVTGHSLGGGLTTVATAWLTSGNLDKSFQLKTYSFAAPKAGNESFANWLNQSLANAQRFFRVYHSMDTIPQVPFTYQFSKADLNNPQMLESLLPASLPSWLQGALDAFLNAELPGGASLNYTHAGAPYLLSGDEPLVFTGEYWPAVYFPGLPPQPFFPVNPNDPPQQQEAELKKQEMMRQWWPHMPWVYLNLLKSLPG